MLSGSSSSNEPVLAEREFFLLFLTFDENLSHYYEDNLRLYLQSDVESFEVSDDFEESNKKKGSSEMHCFQLFSAKLRSCDLLEKA